MHRGRPGRRGGLQGGDGCTGPRPETTEGPLQLGQPGGQDGASGGEGGSLSRGQGNTMENLVRLAKINKVCDSHFCLGLGEVLFHPLRTDV